MISLAALLLISLAFALLLGEFGSGEIALVSLSAIPLPLLVGAISLGVARVAQRSTPRAVGLALLGGLLVGLLWFYALQFIVASGLGGAGPSLWPISTGAATAGLLAGIRGLATTRRLIIPVLGGIGMAGVVIAAVGGIQPFQQHPGFLAVFEPGTPQEEIDAVWDEVLGIQTARGTELMPGIESQSLHHVDGKDAVLVEFQTGASEGEIEAVRRGLEASPVVEDVRVDSS